MISQWLYFLEMFLFYNELIFNETFICFLNPGHGSFFRLQAEAY